MVEREVEIVNKLGMHARAASRFVRLADEFPCDVFLQLGGERVNAKSILGILSLAAAKGTRILLFCDGERESEALESLARLVAERFGEEA
jgi:phosphocarrier protein